MEQDGELVAGPAGDQVVGPDLLLQARSHRGQDLVAHLVAVTRVDQREVVDVHEKQRHTEAGGWRRGQGPVETVTEGRPVGQIG